MELTKTDKKHIDEETNSLMIKIRVESSEYAKLYEKAFYENLMQKIQAEIEAREYVEQWAKNR